MHNPFRQPETIYCLEFQTKYAHLEIFLPICENFTNNIVYFEIEGEKSVESLPDDLWQVQLYLEDEKDIELIKTQIKQISNENNIKNPEVTYYIVEDHDWVSEVQKNFVPINSGRFFIHNSQYSAKKPKDQISIEINAGRAFGTGEHETTSNCLKALSLLDNIHFEKCLDMGCGSAILAIAMAKLWPSEVIAVDIDEQAVKVTQENCQLNQVSTIISGPSDGYKGAIVKSHAPYQLITANILAAPLIAMAKDAYEHLVDGGYLILAGFINNQLGEVLNAHLKQGFILEQKISGSDWPVLIMQKPEKEIVQEHFSSSIEANASPDSAAERHMQQVINPFG